MASPLKPLPTVASTLKTFLDEPLSCTSAAISSFFTPNFTTFSWDNGSNFPPELQVSNFAPNAEGVVVNRGFQSPELPGCCMTLYTTVETGSLLGSFYSGNATVGGLKIQQAMGRTVGSSLKGVEGEGNMFMSFGNMSVTLNAIDVQGAITLVDAMSAAPSTNNSIASILSIDNIVLQIVDDSDTIIQVLNTALNPSTPFGIHVGHASDFPIPGVHLKTMIPSGTSNAASGSIPGRNLTGPSGSTNGTLTGFLRNISIQCFDPTQERYVAQYSLHPQQLQDSIFNHVQSWVTPVSIALTGSVLTLVFLLLFSDRARTRRRGIHDMEPPTLAGLRKLVGGATGNPFAQLLLVALAIALVPFVIVQWQSDSIHETCAGTAAFVSLQALDVAARRFAWGPSYFFPPSKWRAGARVGEAACVAIALATQSFYLRLVRISRVWEFSDVWVNVALWMSLLVFARVWRLVTVVDCVRAALVSVDRLDAIRDRMRWECPCESMHLCQSEKRSCTDGPSEGGEDRAEKGFTGKGGDSDDSESVSRKSNVLPPPPPSSLPRPLVAAFKSDAIFADRHFSTPSAPPAAQIDDATAWAAVDQLLYTSLDASAPPAVDVNDSDLSLSKSASLPPSPLAAAPSLLTSTIGSSTYAETLSAVFATSSTNASGSQASLIDRHHTTPSRPTYPQNWNNLVGVIAIAILIVVVVVGGFLTVREVEREADSGSKGPAAYAAAECDLPSGFSYRYWTISSRRKASTKKKNKLKNCDRLPFTPDHAQNESSIEELQPKSARAGAEGKVVE
ncbi:hypothetical protein BDK51DRAFT_45058 [Blyttiomyces helicus]|uniref:Uncharacterized protein n=1 Tax=Blyttiomyces helicus TaxID=388810 RepID=A0A4P9WEL4_9FUNG|nr:hypothetical protein BDK51DRAFT_45058 [Blyttiomyces helicus]|eukprot:RKO90153.1 hypothetical protein BDK51DRAFT_45058 [Blyttiomyces helicus]